MYDNFQKTNTTIIKIPLVFKEFTDEYDDIIIMERIVGRKLDELPNDIKDEYCTILAKGLIKTVFLDGFYHCDMHPGNVLFIENEHDHVPRFQVAILDFGIMSTINTRDQNLSFDIFRSVLDRNSNNIAKLFVNGFIEPCDKRTSRSYADADICKTLEDAISDILKDKTLTCFTAKDLCAMNYAILKYNMKISSSLTNFEISLSVCDNLCKKIAFNRTYMDHLKSIVDDMFD
jgi:predicted unusual protein kinase regulating ubiquinone biosynthesis (AarF/ABC1/UbiB family)